MPEKLDGPCHADVLLDLAKAGPGSPPDDLDSP
jgi:hypothetical protein